jgi:hypothetical protein
VANRGIRKILPFRKPEPAVAEKDTAAAEETPKRLATMA